MQNYLILNQEPFLGFTPNDVKTWIENDPSEKNIALALSTVWVKLSDVWDEYSDSRDHWALYAAEEWTELNEFLTEKIESILASETTVGEIFPAGSLNRILPFMERNGYRNGSGWWIKE